MNLVWLTMIAIRLFVSVIPTQDLTVAKHHTVTTYHPNMTTKKQLIAMRFGAPTMGTTRGEVKDQFRQREIRTHIPRG